ncbi:MAG: ECF-type sigma factor [Planctomycetota bacterium]
MTIESLPPDTSQLGSGRPVPGEVGPEGPRLTALYGELRAIARGRLDRLPAQTIGATDLVHEALARLLRDGGLLTGLERDHVVALAARTMRNVLVDRARARSAAKRGSGRAALDVEVTDLPGTSDEDLLLVHDALEALAASDARAARVVEMRFFGGLSQTETADALGVNERTVRRDWQYARAWLLREVGSDLD